MRPQEDLMFILRPSSLFYVLYFTRYLLEVIHYEATGRSYVHLKAKFFISHVIYFTRYLLEVIHYEATGGSYVHLKAKFFDTQFTNSWTGKAEQEEQTISISSTVVYDVQVRNRSHMSNWRVLCSSKGQVL